MTISPLSSGGQDAERSRRLPSSMSQTSSDFGSGCLSGDRHDLQPAACRIEGGDKIDGAVLLARELGYQRPAACGVKFVPRGDR